MRAIRQALAALSALAPLAFPFFSLTATGAALPPSGLARGRGKARRREFAMASGEMSEAAFVAFLKASLGAAANQCRDGAIAFVCMDWRHMRELMEAGAAVFDEFKNVCVWTKTNGGMGSLYRSQHEMVFVHKIGQAAHVNNVELGRFCRNRTMSGATLV